MPIDDSNPERKNLIICSLAFIIFFYADGELVDQTLRLPIVNVVFRNTGILQACSWCFLIWFLYRYYLANRFSFVAQIKNDLSGLRKDKNLNKYIRKVIYLKRGPINNLQIQNLKWTPLNMLAVVSYTQKHPSKGGDDRVYLFDTLGGVYIGLKLSIKSLVNNQAFSQQIIPYFLAFLAFTSPLFS